MTPKEESAYMQGMRTANVRMLSQCVQELGYEGRSEAAWIVEREAAIAALRELCSTHGDNDWPDNLHLRDIIEKHLGRHLE
jgi:hypothetical protein